MNTRIRLLKMIDNSIGPLCVRLLPRHKWQGAFPEPRRVLLIRPGGIGDAVMLIPVIQLIKKKFPAAAVHVLAEKRNAEVFSLCPDVERVFRHEIPAELLSAIRGHYDVVIDMEQWHRLSAVIARLVRAPMSVGYATNERKKLFTHPIAYSHDDYEVDSFLHLIEPVTGSMVFDPMRPFLTVPAQEITRATSELRSFSGKKIVALFPGGSIPERQWGIERFHAVAEQIAGNGYGVAVLGGIDDRAAGEGIVRGIPSGLNLCGRLNLSGSAAVLERASLLITGDSGIMHLGYAVGTRVLALFGPGIEIKWAPRSPRVAILNKHLPCSPCTKFGYTPKCPRDTACMKGISTEDVITSAIALLDKV